MPGFYQLCRPLLFMLDPETAHSLSVRALRLGHRCGLIRKKRLDLPRLKQRLWGLDFDNPIGLAAGFDKNAEVIDGAFGLGFGFVEVGTITPLPQPGNLRPRLFRLIEDKAVINRFGFNSKGQEAALAGLKHRTFTDGIVGVNIGANKSTTDRAADYVELYQNFAPIFDYITVNVSSPNTPGLRDLQSGGELGDLLSAVIAARNDVSQAGGKTPPILVKIAPDLDVSALETIIETVMAYKIDGLIISNTTIARTNLQSRFANETGGLSGKPLFAPSTNMLARAYQYSEGKIPIIGAGGVSCARDAFDKITAGASLVQLYSALVYEGPGLVRRVTRGLDEILATEGFASVTEAVGTRADEFCE